MSDTGVAAAEKPYILVLGGSDDIQLVEVIEAVRKRGGEVLFIDHESRDQVSLTIAPDGEVTFEVDGARRAFPTLVWSRIKINPILSSLNARSQAEYVSQLEWRGLLSCLTTIFEDRNITPSRAAWFASTQPAQLSAAGRAGFEVPETALFVGKSKALAMAEAHAALVAKPIAARNVPGALSAAESSLFLGTMGVERDMICSADSEEFDSPLLLQERVMRGAEIRVIAFRERAFCYEIKARIETRVRPDERPVYGTTPEGKALYGALYRPIETPDVLQAAISRFLSEMRLEYATLDIARTDEGRYVFFEANPEGMWYAVNGFNGAEVTDYFAGVLLDRLEANQRRLAAAKGSNELRSILV